MEVIFYFFLALVLTVLIELIVSAFFVKGKPSFFSIVLVNLVTNPLLNFFLYLNALFLFFRQTFVLLIFLEAIVVLVEAAILFWVRVGSFKKMLGLSLLINTCSFVLGVLIFGLPIASLF